MKEYYGAIRKGQGGLFMAVCRGKVNFNTLLGLYISHHSMSSSHVATANKGSYYRLVGETISRGQSLVPASGNADGGIFTAKLHSY